ncbi:MAG: hypothetical protein R3B09_24360 [Nannocystaceae bacterium]
MPSLRAPGGLCGILLTLAIGCSDGVDKSDSASSQGATAATDASATDAATTEAATTQTSTDASTDATTDASTGSASAESTSATDTAAGCVEGEAPPDDPCAAHTDAQACTEQGCGWFGARRYPACDGSCGDAVEFGVCAGWENFPETGCTGPCGRFWRRTLAGVEILEGAFCFDFPRGWTGCWSEGPAECSCECLSR